MKRLIINNIKKTKQDDGKILLEVLLSNENSEKKLWYKFDERYEDFICDELCDGIVVTFLPIAMKFGYDIIESAIPMSEKLYYNLTYHVIPQLYESDKKGLKKLNICIPRTNRCYGAKGVATGMSRGVDSFATVAEYKDFELEDYRVSHYTYFNVGAHHGRDVLVGASKYKRSELFEKQLHDTKAYCEQYGHDLIVVDSNVSICVASKELFGRSMFSDSHTFRNLGTALLLQRGLNKYYYSAAYNLTDFSIALNKDSAHYEKWLIRHLCTENMEFYNSGQEWSRLEKVKEIVKLEESYKYLNVCLVDSNNCGVCVKCRRTLMELDSLGEDILDKYRPVFDIDKYKNENRARWFQDIWYMQKEKKSESKFIKEVLEQAIKTNPEILGLPNEEEEAESYTVYITGNVVNVRAFPSKEASIISSCKKGESLKCIGKWERWLKIVLPDQREGYIHNTLCRK